MASAATMANRGEIQLLFWFVGSCNNVDGRARSLAKNGQVRLTVGGLLGG